MRYECDISISTLIPKKEFDMTINDFLVNKITFDMLVFLNVKTK